MSTSERSSTNTTQAEFKRIAAKADLLCIYLDVMSGLPGKQVDLETAIFSATEVLRLLEAMRAEA